MKKIKIWLLFLIVVFMVAALTIMQVRFINHTSSLFKQQFHMVVENILNQTAEEIEKEEVIKFVEEQLNIYYSEHKAVNQYSTISQTPVEYEGKNEKVNSSIGGVNRTLTEKYQKEYLQNKMLLNNILAKLMLESSERMLSERVNFDDVLNKITTRLQDINIELPFYLSISDNYNRVIFSNNNLNYKTSSVVFRQTLFENEKKLDSYHITLSFSEKEAWFHSQLTSMTIAMIITTILLLLVIVAFIHFALLQHREHEIKTDFLNNMTHELKTPIASISLASQMLKDSAVLKAPAMLENISRIVSEETKRLNILVEKVLQTSIFDSEKSILQLKEDDVNDLIHSVINNFSVKIYSQNGKINTSLQAENAVVMLDDTHFTNVIYNLLENSLKYRRDSLIINVLTYNFKDTIVIEVADNGVGINNSDLKHIFEKFYRVYTGNTHDVKGYGLGLAYVKKIVEQHSGTISVESELGVGTKFIIKLPIVKIDN
jgi:signal transduction histidine kinase